MKTKTYSPPKIDIAYINFENCIANSSIRNVEFEQESLSIEIFDWQVEDGFTIEDVGI